MKADKNGWYVPINDNGKEGREYVGETLDDLIGYLDERNELCPILVEWAKTYYDFKDILTDTICENTPLDYNQILDDWKSKIEDDEKNVIRLKHGNGSAFYFWCGEETDVDYIIDRTEMVKEDKGGFEIDLHPFVNRYTLLCDYCKKKDNCKTDCAEYKAVMKMRSE